MLTTVADDFKTVAAGVLKPFEVIWETINSHVTWVLDNEIKSWVDGAIDAVTGFVLKVVSFGIDVVLPGIIQFGQIVLFLKDLFSDPMKCRDQAIGFVG